MFEIEEGEFVLGKEHKDSEQIIWETGNKTIEDYHALPDERRVELIDGVFYDMAAPSYVHQNISGMIYHILMRHVEKNKGSCMPFISPADVQLFGDDKTMVQPDVFVVCNRDRITYARLVNAPDLVIEVISPSTRRKDMDLKLRRYREAGVREYWIVFPEEKQLWVYLFGEKDTGSEAHQVYTFADKVPVGIWGGACEVDFVEIDERCEFLYQV
ncbi:MAG: Uma2 family endonuclease [Lachnospiraceae bacterium]|nr:Uma2 family endonuclease [Lachnospiraceae bacterium]MBR1851718.1 Uma2 family endonuclease [Lachnospiraceae bacterium]